jgi:branched-chain amino acid transport system ATP-binding protein
MTILVVEQNARAALELADRAYVMESGQVVMEGTAAELVEDERMQTAYLGKRGAKEASPSTSDDTAD